jgi:hypothetical protein
MTLTRKNKKHYAGHTPTATLGVCRAYADGLEYTEGDRRRISNAVTAGNFGATCLQSTPTARIRRGQSSAYGRLRRRQPYGDSCFGELSWRPPTPTAPTFGRRRMRWPSAPLAIPVVSLPYILHALLSLRIANDISALFYWFADSL